MSTKKAQIVTPRNNSLANRLWLFAITAILLTQSVGCCFQNGLPTGLLDKPLTCYRDKVWAKRAYNLRYGNCDRQYGDHFEEGFINGYCNVCNGGDGYVPAMPPEDYWGYEYQSPVGAQCVNAWFQGYPSGAVAAKKDSAGKFREMYISNMVNAAVVQEDATKVLPSDIPVTQANGAGQSNVPNQLRLDSPDIPVRSSAPSGPAPSVDPSVSAPPLPMVRTVGYSDLGGNDNQSTRRQN